jgi:acyl-homoserine-lactone acylase
LIGAVTVVLSTVGLAADAPPLAKRVQIQRTQYGVPHITGDTLGAAAFGLGYCQAEDHCLDIMRGVLAVRGTLADSFGAGEESKNVESDFFNRQFRVYERSIASYHTLDPDYREMLAGFAGGLNFFAGRHRDQLPPWMPEVTAHDIAAYGVAGVMRFAFNRNNILKEFLAEQNVKTAMFDHEPDETMTGSNMWAFAPSRSESGHAMLMGNPHQPWAPVSTYYEAHVIVPGRMNFYGSTFIGRPILTSGWNEHLGWSHTVNQPDLEEIYEVALDPARPDHYLFDGGSVPLTRDDVTISIRSGTDRTDSMRTFWHAPLGPVVYRTDKKAYILRNASYENYRPYEQWLRMSQAKNLDEFRSTLALNLLPMFNICYADRVGNIFFIWNGTVPDLPHPAHRAEPVPAAGTADVWTRIHGTDELPQLLNPRGGYVQNCNSPPYLTNLRVPLDPARFPTHFSPNDLSLRTQHSLQLIDNDRKLSLDEVIRLKHSPRMLLADRVKKDLIEVMRATGPTAEVEAALTILDKWDNTVAAGSRGGALFAAWWDRYYDKAKETFSLAWNAAEPMTTPRGLADRERAVKAFGRGLDDVISSYGATDISWGDAHRIRKGNVDLPVSGGPGLMGCFRVIEFRKDHDRRMVANSGDSFVFAVEFSDPPRAFTNVAYSQSGVSDSPHFADQAPLFSANRLKPAAFTAEEIKAQAIKSYRPGEE